MNKAAWQPNDFLLFPFVPMKQMIFEFYLQPYLKSHQSQHHNMDSSIQLDSIHNIHEAIVDLLSLPQ